MATVPTADVTAEAKRLMDGATAKCGSMATSFQLKGVKVFVDRIVERFVELRQAAEHGTCEHALFVTAVDEYAERVWSVSKQDFPAADWVKKLLAPGQTLAKWRDAIALPAARKRAAQTELPPDPRQGKQAAVAGLNSRKPLTAITTNTEAAPRAATQFKFPKRPGQQTPLPGPAAPQQMNVDARSTRSGAAADPAAMPSIPSATNQRGAQHACTTTLQPALQAPTKLATKPASKPVVEPALSTVAPTSTPLSSPPPPPPNVAIGNAPPAGTPCMHGGVFGAPLYDTQQQHDEIAVQALNKFAAEHVGVGLDATNPLHYNSLLMLLKGAVVGSVMGSGDVLELLSMLHNLHGISHLQCDVDLPALSWSPPELTVERISGPAICFDDDGMAAMVQSWRFQLDHVPYFLVEDLVLLTGQQLLRPLYDQAFKHMEAACKVEGCGEVMHLDAEEYHSFQERMCQQHGACPAGLRSAHGKGHVLLTHRQMTRVAAIMLQKGMGMEAEEAHTAVQQLEWLPQAEATVVPVGEWDADRAYKSVVVKDA